MYNNRVISFKHPLVIERLLSVNTFFAAPHVAKLTHVVEMLHDALSCGCIDKIEDARDALRGSLEEARSRRRFGLKRAKTIRRLVRLKKSRARVVPKVKKMHRPWRAGAVYNRHR